jgi:multiple sugar transport system permease protein
MTAAVVERPRSATENHPPGRRPKGRRRYLAGAICIALSTIMLLPLVASVLASLKPTAEAAQSPPTYFPKSFSFESYRRLWDYQAGLPHYAMNSLVTALLTVLFSLVLTTLAGYGLARFPVPLKEPIFVVLLLTLIVPYQSLLTPVFLMFSDLGLTNSLVGLALIHTAIQLPFSVYIMRNCFESVPRELEEAAMIDGASSIQILWRIFLPAAVPALITVSLFAFITSWNEFLGALVMMNTDSKFTLPLILSASRTQTTIGGTDWGMLQAGVTISIIPCVAVYLLLQRYFVAGFLTGALK